ncbi:beta/gamma crystallin-related protein [Nostoc sp. ChiQUE01b]|uniref:beta/gamma crystallin-related protein n=1 Tax=Nostoc sp. ChiQUE01b TaxID=3075376 RepID=UPI002AD3D901|nr:beta/gamma crystallin-related protein [Nostoc sp. ChiQUE01b]MDZ8263327.1 beta/gamma crystallin-related protein [Nostoc sp. ChiQUE01b]
MNNNTLAQLNLSAVKEINDDVAATCSGGAKVQVFTNPNFSGTASNIIDYDVPGLSRVFNDKISSIKVLSGKWTFWSDANFSGKGISLTPGNYRNLAKYSDGAFNNVISSFKRDIR